MSNRFGIPNKVEKKIRARDKKCVYCHKIMFYPCNNRKDNATIEHLNRKGPFYWIDGKKGLKIENIAICCGQCNSSRGRKRLRDWFETEYCKEHNINEKRVALEVKKYLKSKKSRY